MEADGLYVCVLENHFFGRFSDKLDVFSTVLRPKSFLGSIDCVEIQYIEMIPSLQFTILV